ncbi:hypothetical protein QEN19_000123 [Hanseniaspora menglaensis]
MSASNSSINFSSTTFGSNKRRQENNETSFASSTANKRRPSNSGTVKRFRAKQPTFLNQQPSKLNIKRIFDLLNKEQLVHLLTKTIEIEPRLEEFLVEESEIKFFQNNGTKFKLLQEKLLAQFEKLMSMIPFERNQSFLPTFNNDVVKDFSTIVINDYSFEKIKTSYLDFLNLIYDYNEYALKFCSLNMEIWNLVEISLKILINLPTLENKVNNYYKNYLIEKLDNLIVSVLIQQSLENNSETAKNIEMIINMNKTKLSILIEALGAGKLTSVKKFVEKLSGGSSCIKPREENSASNYINNFLSSQHEQPSFLQQQLSNQNIDQNNSLSFHDSILITGIASKNQEQQSCISFTDGSEHDSRSTNSEYSMTNPGSYLT